MIKIFEKQSARILLAAIRIAAPVMMICSLAGQPPDCSRRAGDLSDPYVEAGTPDESIPIDRIIVIMQENHSFDNYFGRLNEFGYQGEVDGLTDDMHNLDYAGTPIFPFHEWNLYGTGLDHSWNGTHIQYNYGRNDMFVIRNGRENTMAYYDESDLPYYYALANEYAIADRYFSSLLGPSDPQAYYLVAGTSFGHIRNDGPPSGGFTERTIFHVLTDYGISWKFYHAGEHHLLNNFALYGSDWDKLRPIYEYFLDLINGELPQVAFLASEYNVTDEHPGANIQVGQAFVASLINALMESSAWPTSAFFLTYDEHDGYFDHVPPPEACIPDAIPPMLQSGDFEADFDRYGFRVPFLVVSPYAKRHYVSHNVYDHTSILSFIESKYNLPALTNRDANADPMFDLFDFDDPKLGLPELPRAIIR